MLYFWFRYFPVFNFFYILPHGTLLELISITAFSYYHPAQLKTQFTYCTQAYTCTNSSNVNVLGHRTSLWSVTMWQPTITLGTTSNRMKIFTRIFTINIMITKIIVTELITEYLYLTKPVLQIGWLIQTINRSYNFAV